MLTLNKRFLIILLSFIILFSFAFGKSYAIVNQTYDFYVNDSANILDNKTEDYIININNTLNKKTGAQIVVVTVNSLEGMSVEDYALELFRSYGIGDSKKNNGVLLLVAVEERKVRIEVGYGLEGRLTDGKTGRILDNYVIPYFKDDKWNDGILNGFNAILEEVTAEYGITIDDATEALDISHLENVQYLTGFIVFIICLIVRHIFVSKKWLVGLRNCSNCNNY